MKRRAVVCRLLALVLAEVVVSVAAAAEDGGLRRRSLHQPFFPIEWSPPPPVSGGLVVPPPPAASASSATGGGGRSAAGVTNTVAIALSAGLVALAVLFYSCFLLRRRADGGDGDRATTKPVRALAARDPSDDSRNHRSPPPSSTASDAIYLDPLTTMVELRQHQQSQSPDLRPLSLLKQPSPDLRPLPPLKRPAQQPPPPPASTPPMTTTGNSSDEEDQATYYTAPKTAKSSFSRSTSQRSTQEQTAAASAPPPPPPAAQAVPLRPARPPPAPPLPRQRLLRPMPSESPPPAALANIALTTSPETSLQDRGRENSDGLGVAGSTRPPKPPFLKPLHWDKLRAVSSRTTVWDQVKNSDSFRVDEAAMESLFLKDGGAGNSGQAAKRGGAGKQESRLLNPKRLQNVAIMLKALNVTVDDVIGALVHGTPEDLGPEFYETLAKMAPTKEEELKLKDYSGDLSKIDPAERFLKGVLDVPFAFKRVDAMLYRANFHSEVNYLRKSFGTLENFYRQLVQI